MVREESVANDVLRRIRYLSSAAADALGSWRWSRTMGPRGAEEKRLARELVDEIACLRFGGAAGDDAATAFRRSYYDRLPDDGAKRQVRKLLLRMLRYGRYDRRVRLLLATACAELGMEEAAEDIALIREAAGRNISVNQLLRFRRERIKEAQERCQGPAGPAGRGRKSQRSERGRSMSARLVIRQSFQPEETS